MKTGEQEKEAKKRSRPIGVFDSGIGGLTVVSALRKVLPNETIYYLGDTARVPYGGKSAATVERYSLEIGNMLLEEDCKAIVVACNTASALALPRLEEMSPVPVMGVAPALLDEGAAGRHTGSLGAGGAPASEALGGMVGANGPLVLRLR